MNARAIKDITNFIFMQDAPAQSDVIFIPGTARSAIAEKAASLYHADYADLVMPSGMYSTNNGRFASENIDDPRYIGEY